MKHEIHCTPRSHRFVFLLAFAMTASASPALAELGSLSDADVAGIRRTVETYRSAWLVGDAEGVLATFTDDAVLLPHHGDAPVSGKTAIRAYWFPPAAASTTITELTITIEETRGTQGFAFVYGRDTVQWTTSSGGTLAHFHNAGTYMNVMEKSADGSWRIRAHMWDDPANLRKD